MDERANEKIALSRLILIWHERAKKLILNPDKTKLDGDRKMAQYITLNQCADELNKLIGGQNDKKI